MLSNLAFVKFTWHLPLLIIKQLAPKKVQVSPIWLHLEPEYALEARRMAIALPGELQESVGPGPDGRAWQVGRIPENHRASGYALECYLEGFVVLDGLKSMPSRERICLGGP